MRAHDVTVPGFYWMRETAAKDWRLVKFDIDQLFHEIDESVVLHPHQIWEWTEVVGPLQPPGEEPQPVAWVSSRDLRWLKANPDRSFRINGRKAKNGDEDLVIVYAHLPKEEPKP